MSDLDLLFLSACFIAAILGLGLGFWIVEKRKMKRLLYRTWYFPLIIAIQLYCSVLASLWWLFTGDHRFPGVDTQVNLLESILKGGEK